MASSFTVPDILQKKRDGLELSKEEIEYFIQKVTSGEADDSQIGAMCMAIYIHGMNDEETGVLTQSMVNSGETLDWNKDWKDLLVDKHSTGGCGDKISLVLAPALAAFGLKVPMMSGRGLAHTGGTLDKLESIPGFRVELSKQEMEKALERAGCFIAGPTQTIAPADKKLYRIRDITATVASIPLIVGSIISKKVAEGAKYLVMDIKVGSAAFCKEIDMARKLSSKLIAVSHSLGVKTSVVISKMDTPIGKNVGNALEVAEAIECLKGNGPEDLMQLITTLGAVILQMKTIVKTLEEGKAEIEKVIKNGKAMEHFCTMLQCQGVTSTNAKTLCYGDMWQVLPQIPREQIAVFKAESEGVVSRIDAMGIAKVVWHLGAGRSKAGDPIDYRVGIKFLCKEGATVKPEQQLLEIHHNTAKLDPEIHKRLKESIVISQPNPEWNQNSNIIMEIRNKWTRMGMPGFRAIPKVVPAFETCACTIKSES